MENSFVEYRNHRGLDSDSDTEVIDDSLTEDLSFVRKKQTAAKNQTVFVAESEESVTEDEVEEEDTQRLSKSVARRSIAKQPLALLSSDDDTNRRGSIRRQSETSPNRVVLSSSDEGETSPEVVPKRPTHPARLSESFIGRKTKKRMMVLDSDTDNSIIIEHDRHNKLVCLKDTPAKIESTKIIRNNITNMSFQEDEDDDSTNYSDNDAKSGDDDKEIDDAKSGDDDKDLDDAKSDKGSDSFETKDNKDTAAVEDNDERIQHDDNGQIGYDEDDDGPDEDQMVFSRATRMSIMGMIPKENDSDDSDYIQSDDTNHTSHGSLTNTTSDLPEPNVTHTPQKENDGDDDTSRLTCSPFGSPLQDITNMTTMNRSVRKSLTKEPVCEKPPGTFEFIKPKPIGELLDSKARYSEEVIDDDVTIIDTKPEIIALSSDDEDEMPAEKKSPNMRKTTQVKAETTTPKPSGIKQYLVPPSYPNQVVYVRKHVRENELSKLNGLKEELQNIRYLLEHMEMETLPDGGAKLIERLSALEADVRRQGDKVANMVVEPDKPTPDDIAKDGFDGNEKTPSWDDIQKASNAVQPRMFGKHAMATHMAERNLIMERLRDLHEALASRPAEGAHAPPPAALRTALMPHQRHALAWLRWRETQRPPGGILADDMGLGKTITMISLIASDKEGSIDDDEEDNYNDKGRAIRGGTLVVCPASLMQQWAGEVAKHCRAHSLSVCLHHGAARTQHAHRLAASDLVLTTYNILQRENEKKGVLTKVSWHRAILDEAHVVRNHKAATSTAVCALRARRRWALTGTPLHNKDLDLFALLKFLRCTPFDDLAMWKKWIDNKSLGGQERLSMIMRCVMLRRTKAQLQQRGQLACLPARAAHDIHVTLSKEEMNVYQKVLVFSKTLFAQFLHQRSEKQVDGFGSTRLEKDNAYALHKKMVALQGVKPVKSHEILVLLLRLRQVCCHCGLIAGMLHEDDEAQVDEDPAGRDLLAELNKLSLNDSKRKSGKHDEDSGGEEGAPEEGTTAAEAIRSVLSPNNPVFQLDTPSSKIAAVLDCLNKNVFPNKGEKAVVVSQWTSVLRLVEHELTRARVRCVTLCGSVPVAARQPLVDALNDQRPGAGATVMLLSLCAGGVGLNLCGASHLLLLDPHWNPQLEEQAQDRIYRVGQTRPVNIYRFMCLDTVEQTIRKLQQAKLELADNILTGARNTNASKLTIEDLKMLFNMGPADS